MTRTNPFTQPQGELDLALPFFEKALEYGKFIKHDILIATYLNNLADVLSSQGKFLEAEPLYRQSIEVFKKVLGPDHPNVATLLNNLALLLKSQGKKSEAKTLGKEALAIRIRALGPDHPTTMQAQKDWGQ